jgi:hypothetical protein
MVTERARERSKRKKAAIAGRLTQRSNAEIICALAYCLRHYRHGEWTPGEVISARFKSMNRKMRDAEYCARRMLKIHVDKKTGRYYMRKHPEMELEKFGLRWIDWQALNPDLHIDKSIIAFDLEHGNLWRMIKSFLLGEDLPIDGCFTPWQEPRPMDCVGKQSNDPIAASFQTEIHDQLGLNDFVAGVAACAQDPKPQRSRNVIREVNGQRFLKSL